MLELFAVPAARIFVPRAEKKFTFCREALDYFAFFGLRKNS